MNVLPGVWREYQPYHPDSVGIRALLRQVDSLFNEAFGQSSETQQTPSGATFVPEYAVDESDHHYILSFDIPGVSKDDLAIEVRGNQLSISGERKFVGDTKTRRETQQSRRYGTFQRLISLPDGIKAEDVEADYQDGVLKIVVPKPSATRATKIAIGTAKTGGHQGVLADKAAKSGAESGPVATSAH